MTLMLLGLLLIALPAMAQEAEKVGKRPYEMEWANRHEDDHPPLVDFEDLSGWRVECKHAEASIERTREQQIWGRYVGKLTYRGIPGGGPEVRIVPPEPIPITQPFDAVTLWAYGDTWGWAPDPNRPHVGISALFEDAQGEEFGVLLYHVDWSEWYLLHKRLTPEQIARVRDGARFIGLSITGGRNKQDRVLYLDNLAVFTEEFAPLKFEPRPRRGIPMFPGQSVGTNTGPGKLPFPTRPQTILPDNLTTGFKTSVRMVPGQGEPTFVFTYAGREGTLVYRLTPKTGTWSDLTAQWRGRGTTIRPCVDGGVWLQTAKGPVLPEKAQHLGTRLKGDAVESRWRLSAGEVTAEVAYTYRIWNKSLVIDVICRGGKVGEVRCGRAVGLQNPRLVTNPFYPAEGGRPAVAVSGPANQPLFLTANVDWYLSNGSILWANNAIEPSGVVYNGGTRYLPLTNGQRVDCYERVFLTLSPYYEEMLPTIPNPKSPWKHITGTRVWRAHAAGNRESDAQHWTECHRWGMRQVVITDHETGWRDGGESFTFRTRPAPGKGGDKGQYDYARLMQDKLGFVYGPYNNFTDFAPVNEYWSTDMIARTPDNQLQHAWMRCYAPKPARAVEYAAKLPYIIQKKFGFSTAYCDVHTAVAPWHRTDYDARVPGAGTFAAVFYAYGEIMLHQKKAWGGPVYSEGNHHCFYSGLTDGNYGQDQAYRPAENPWLVDFDLRKMHDLCCNFGMGNPDMFYANAKIPRDTPEQRDAWIDRFLAATVAFGHPGFLAYEGGLQNALRSYYMLQQLHSRYCLSNVASIRYVNSAGRLLTTTAAVASGAYKRSQVVTRYLDGTVTAANGSPTERMVVQAYGRKIDLPPNGYCGWTQDGAIEVWSADPKGHRSDYAATPEYLYVDGRGRFMRFPKAAGNGIGICRILPKGEYEVLLYGGADCGFAINATRATALDKAGKPMGPAKLRTARGLTYVVPVEGAFSYLLSSTPAASAKAADLTCDREEVFAGEQVTIRGKDTHTVRIDPNAKVGERVWIQKEGRWIDFTVVPLTTATLSLEGNTLVARLSSNLPRPALFTVTAAGKEQQVRLEPGQPTDVRLDLGVPQQESAEVLTLTVRTGEMAQRLERGLTTVESAAPLLPWPQEFAKGMCLRGGEETAELGESGTGVAPRRVSSGEVEKDGLFMHPPWQGGTGYAFARYEPVTLPAQPPAAFRAFVGKLDGSDLGDGILYKVAVIDAAGTETVVAEQTVTTHAWVPIEADLSRWAGQRVALKLIVDPGPADNSTGDWGCWGEMRLETRDPVLHRNLEQNVEVYRREPSPHPIAGITQEELRNARSGRLYYDGKGLTGTGEEYGSFAVLNGVLLGNLAPAAGVETEGVFATDVSIPLTPEAIRTLSWRNRVAIRNPKRDSFSIRRFRLELELADGRRCSSDIAAATYTQPGDWRYAEGIGVPFESEIQVDLWFRP